MSTPSQLATPVVEQTEEERLELKHRVVWCINRDQNCEIIGEVLSRRPEKAEAYIVGQRGASYWKNEDRAMVHGDPKSFASLFHTFGDFDPSDIEPYRYVNLREYYTAEGLVRSLRVISSMRGLAAGLNMPFNPELDDLDRILVVSSTKSDDLDDEDRMIAEALLLRGVSNQEIELLHNFASAKREAYGIGSREKAMQLEANRKLRKAELAIRKFYSRVVSN